MRVYYFFKNLFLNYIIKMRQQLLRFNLTMLVRKKVKIRLKEINSKKLSNKQLKEIRLFYRKRGYKHVRTHWHRFYTAANNQFSEKYIPEDIFHVIVSNALNEMKQWPALLDKNLSERLFNGFKQPVTVVKNVNGFYYVNDRPASMAEAIESCCNYEDRLVIKPTIESGGGREVIGFSIVDRTTNHKSLTVEELLNYYKKDFIIQGVVNQHAALKKLNSSSLNTLRIMTYLKEDDVHVLSAILRIGSVGMFTDNSASGGMVCGIKEDGKLREFGYLASGDNKTKTDTNIVLKDHEVPSYNKALDMVKEMHSKVPYFRIISWDIAIDQDGDPVFIEYNTYRQSIGIHQFCNGPLFGDFTDELLEIGRQYKSLA